MVERQVPKSGYTEDRRRRSSVIYLKYFKQVANATRKVNRAKSSIQLTISITPFMGSEPAAKRQTFLILPCGSII